ncbi:DUF2017 domain-containing protein [Phycicoccus sp. Root563]|uniref:DUF2017 domain-containing protein n=1 Tax=Phycicoccus sp. Root563 TaxID=1736562 RepID=UPI000703B307|nr:DUF2017 domain-containing protein [Phycicoccus sp. Root563]KQZ87706.1 hypothetical protein ASD62_19455 [Phycicoccus sp. Root563]
MARGFKKRHGAYVAKLDAVERGLVVGLMEQVRELVEPAPVAESPEGGGDEFDRIVAGLGGIGMGISLAADDQVQLAGGVPAPRDPALDRIFPTANRQDDQIAAEFRQLTEQGLRARKTANLDTAIAALAHLDDQKVSLDQAQAVALVVALTDVRLVLGERLGLKQDDDLELIEEQVSSLQEDDPAVYALAVYDFLTWLQETLAHALAP